MAAEKHLLNFLHDLDLQDIKAEALHQSRRCLLDLIGVLAAGTTTPLARIINDHAVSHFGPGIEGGGLLGDGRIASLPGIALAGGMTIDSIDAHDGMKRTKGHAGCGVLPALAAYLQSGKAPASTPAPTLATAPARDEDLLAGLIIGYEIAIRAGIALHRTAADYHTSGAWVALAAAAIGCRFRGCSSRQTLESLGIAEYHGPRSQMMRTIDHPTMVKDGSGWGAMAGVSACLLAEDGFTGAPALTVTSPEVADLWDDLGSTWHIIDQYIKPWPVCRWAQPAVTAALDLRNEFNINHDNIEKIKIYSFHEAVRLACRIPETTEEAQYSLPWPVAASVVDGVLGTRQISAPFDDPAITRLALGMELAEDDAHNAVFPEHRLARVEIFTRDGKRYLSADTAATWDPEAPPSDTEMEEKFHALADPVMGTELAGNIRRHVWAMGEGGHAAPLLALITSPFGRDR
ncbi:MmgE/PrpD family protein [Alphaproteobacteria bacterium LSUCC0684]